MTEAVSESPPLEVDVEPPVEPPVEALLPIPKKKGRPPGSADAVPRTRRPNIRIEPIVEFRMDTPRRVKDVIDPAVVEPAPIAEPLTPRTALRDANMHVVNLRNEFKNSRRNALASAYSSKLCQWDAVV